MMNAPKYQHIARLLVAMSNCQKSGNTEWEQKHKDSIREICDTLPSGSGINDAEGTMLDFALSNPDKLVFPVSYHHMDSNGFYGGYTDHVIIVRPSLVDGMEIQVTGRDRNDVKEYLATEFMFSLTREIEG